MAPPEPVRDAVRVLGRYRRVSRTVAAAALLYSVALVLTGGFDVDLAGFTLRSHEINRFVTVAVVAGLFDVMGSETVVSLIWSFGSTALAATLRVVPALLAVVGVGVALAAILWAVAGIARSMTGETPFGDMALLEIYTRHAVKNDLLVGPYSRFLWHHPGPTMFYLLRPLYELTGEHFESLRWSALLFNTLCLGTILEIVRRRARSVLAWTVTIGVALYLYRFPDLLISAWNPHLLVLPLGVMLVAAAAILDGDPRWWPLVAAVGSFLIQTHLSVAPAVGAVVLGTIAWTIATTSDVALQRRHRWWMGASACIVAAMWALPLADQLSSPTGNFTAIYRSFFQKPQASPPLADAFAASLNMLSAPVVPGLEFALGGLVVRTVSLAGVVIAVGALLAAPWTTMRLARQGDRFGASLAAVCLIASLAAIWSVARIQGEILDQLIFWITIVGLLTLACLVAAVGGLLLGRAGSMPGLAMRLATAGLVVLVIAASGSNGLRHLYRAHAWWVQESNSHKVQTAADDLAAYLTQQDLHKPFVRIVQPTWGDAAGILLALQKTGVTLAVEPKWIFMFGTPFAATGDEDCEVVFADASHGPALKTDSRFALVGEWPDLSVHVARLTPRVMPTTPTN